MHVDDTPLEAIQEGGADDAHEAGEDHQGGGRGGDAVCEGDVPGVAVLVVLRSDDVAGDRPCCGDGERPGLGAVGDQERDPGPAAPRVDRVAERFEIGTAPGGQDDDVEGGHDT